MVAAVGFAASTESHVAMYHRMSMQACLRGALLLAFWQSPAPELTAAGGIFEQIVCPADHRSPRNSEGAVLVLKNGNLLLAYTEFFAGDGSDWGAARINGKISRDAGRSWSQPFTIVANQGRMNVMAASLLRLRSGKLALTYNLKNSEADCRVLFRTSSDEGKTWSEPVTITPAIRYWVINNDRLVQLRSGELLAPVTFVDDWRKSHHTQNVVFRSGDAGRSWDAGDTVDIPNGRRGADEPGVIELRDGRIMMIIRSDLGKIFRCYSSDGARHWTAPEPMPLDSPTAPASIARVPSTGDLLLVWNNSRPGPKHMNDRFPLTAAVSRDEGLTWEHIRNLDETPGHTYSYTSIAFLKKNRILFTYYSATPFPNGPEDHSGVTLLSLKLKIVPVRWLYGRASGH